MNTFLPFESFEASALALDDKRLGKQRLEARQLLSALTHEPESGWASHPCTKMWKGHEWWLASYGVAVCKEWAKRGFSDAMGPLFQGYVDVHGATDKPWWLGDERLHSSHRANLVRKDPKRYKAFLGFIEDPMEGYWWPE